MCKKDFDEIRNACRRIRIWGNATNPIPHPTQQDKDWIKRQRDSIEDDQHDPRWDDHKSWYTDKSVGG